MQFSSTQSFAVGDIIQVSKTDNTVNTVYNGLQTVTAILTPTFLTTTATFSGVTVSAGGDGGTIVYMSRVNGTFSSYRAWNGTRQYDQRTKNFFNDYIQSSSSTPFLTNYPVNTYKPIYQGQYENLTFLADDPAYDITNVVVKTYNAANTLLLTVTQSISTDHNYRVFQVSTGTQNVLGFSGMTFSGSAKYYTVQLRGATASDPGDRGIFYYEIFENCSIYTNYRLVFLNRLGGYDFVNFSMDSTKTTAINTTEFKKTLDWDYSIGDRGYTVLANKVEESYKINSNWMREDEYAWLEELVTSPEVYSLEGTDLVPIVVMDKSYTSKTAIRDKVIMLTLTFKYAYDICIQNS